MARSKTFPDSGRLMPASYKALPSVKAFLAGYGGSYSSNASEGARAAIRRLCELSQPARLLMGQVVDAGFVAPPGMLYETGAAAAAEAIIDVGIDTDASTKYGETMEGGSVTLTPAETEFLKRMGKGVGGGLRLVVQELVRLGDMRACDILTDISQAQFVPPRWVEYALAV